MALWQISVNVRAIYEVEAPTEEAAKKIALKQADDGKMPDEMEYAGDGVDNAVLISGESEDDD